MNLSDTPAPSIAERIASVQDTMSRSQHKLAEYVLAHQFRAATMTIDEFAAANGVSIATANRFARTLGLPGYPQFRAELARGFESALAPVERLRTQLAQPASAADVFANSLREDASNIERTLQAMDPRVIDRAVDAILSADRIAIVGFGASGYLAGLMQRALFVYCGSVDSLATPAGVSWAARQIYRLTPKDLLIPISFPRYLNDTVTLATAAKAAGVQVLALTDKPTSPLAPTTTVGALYAQSERQYSSNSEAAALCLIEALSAAVAYKAKDSIQAAVGVTRSVMPWLIHGAGDRKR
ncbi:MULTISPECIES: MurR/RpiR family transcriptional regulator [unclassified Achromobacter]|uniref:MurR/RpiR family transcriptional regulator n=1 Tax=unclassified Achromobacter TaxID=2626865 RepID=UPI002101CE1D|nr:MULTISPECIES: MurR/RpiR family transcriptional regulator [unclassified Achromobacter]